MRTGNSQLREAVVRFKDIRARTLDLLRGISQEQAEFSPDGHRWSLAQNGDHLLLTERLYRQQALELIEAAQSGFPTTIQMDPKEMNPSLAFVPPRVIAALSLPLRMMNRLVPHEVRKILIRVPFVRGISPTASEPRRHREIAQIVSDLESSLAETIELPKAERGADLTLATVEHPLLGRNNAVQLLQLMSAHEQRHYDQMRHILTDSGLQSSVPLSVSQVLQGKL